MAWRLAKSLEVLRNQLNAAYPNRSKASDGTIGDTAHASRPSDHNPNSKGVVTAIDITHDPKNGLDCNVLAEALRNSRDPRIKYVIWNKRAFDPYNLKGNWDWQPYSGSNPHTKHLHISVKGDYDNTADWQIGGEMRPLNKGDHVNISNVTGVPLAEVASKEDWNDVFYAILQHLITKLRKENAELNKRPTQTQLDGLRSELNKAVELNTKLSEKLKEAENKPPKVVEKEVEKIVEVPVLDASKWSIGDLLKALVNKILGVK